MQITETYWEVTTPYDGQIMNHRESQNFFRDGAIAIGCKYDRIDWSHATSVPANWAGYDINNPSPGYTTNEQVWRLYDRDVASIFCLLYGSSIKQVNV